jgi:hypothetical protein
LIKNGVRPVARMSGVSRDIRRPHIAIARRRRA